MAETRAELIERLLRDGLTHYGAGRVAQAVHCWRQVLVLDPEHAEARDYLEAATEEDPTDAWVGTHSADGRHELLEEALRRMRDDDPEGALELLEALAERAGGELEVEGYIEMIRGRLLEEYRKNVGRPEAIPQVRVKPEELLRFNLPKEAGFVLSQIDGATSVGELTSLCAMEEFRLLRILKQLVDAGVVEVRP